ncbi:MAG: hypothetical protein ACTSRG_18670 [Candidatus Helarchaeota archaeon]
MDYLIPNILVLGYSVVLLIINLISIKYNENDRLSDNSKKVLGSLAVGILIIQIILLSIEQLFVSSVIMLLYAPGMAVAKFSEDKKGLNATKDLLFFGLLLFGVSFSYLIVPSPIFPGFTSTPDLIIGVIIFGLGGACYLGLSIFFGCIFITDKYGTKIFDESTVEWIKAIGNFFFIAAFLGISISILNFLIFDRILVNNYFYLIMSILISGLAILGILGLILFVKDKKEYIHQIGFAIIYFIVFFGLFLLSFVILQQDLFIFFMLPSIYLVSMVAFIIIYVWVKERTLDK